MYGYMFLWNHLNIYIYYMFYVRLGVLFGLCDLTQLLHFMFFQNDEAKNVSWQAVNCTFKGMIAKQLRAFGFFSLHHAHAKV